MSFNFKPNENQKKLIESLEGIKLVDAGAGTGKTSTITRRYINIVDKKNVRPDDILLITFTNNAAEQMKDKVLKNSGLQTSEIEDAPISTFHSHCKRIIDDYGYSAPEVLGINDRITSSTRILKRAVFEKQEFVSFFKQFMDQYPEHENFYRAIRDEVNLLDLIKNLAAKGIFPTDNGWFRNSEQYLDGNYDEFEDIFQKVNSPNKGMYGPKQSDLRARLNSYKWKCFVPGAPDASKVLGDRGSKRVRKDFAEKSFNEDREELKKFLHDVYYEYIKYALRRNYLNFSFLLMFAYALLFKNHDLREKLSFKYVMIDEFQDTNEIQFKLALLLSEEDNICVVGDWKQSIYSFQYAAVENIRNFEERLKRYKSELNEGYDRVDFSVDNVQRINLVKNYRSTQDILDFAEQSLTLEASNKEDLNEGKILENITSLEAVKENTNTDIKAYISDDEKKAVLSKIREIVDNDDYVIEEDGDQRKIKYKDIAVLSRTRRFGLQLQEEARKYGIPVAYEGGIELFKTNPAILLLAWLRILDFEHSKRGWSVVLEEAGYKLDEVEAILDNSDYPPEMVQFRSDLSSCREITTIARKVFSRYGLEDAFTDKIIDVLNDVYQNSYMNLGDMISFMEDNINSREIYEVDNSLEENVVKLQTLHSAKGLEYPVVFISDVNQRVFPSTNSGSKNIEYADPVGLRQKKVYHETDDAQYVYDNWRSEILFRCLSGNYDEERRLMYVGMTRAENYLFITSTKDESSKFFTGLNIDEREIEPELMETGWEREKKNVLKISEVNDKAPIKFGHETLLGIESLDFEELVDYVNDYRAFAGRYSESKLVVPEDEIEERIKEVIDNSQKVLCNKKYVYPFNSDEDNRRVVVEGTIDLISIDNGKAKVYSFYEKFIPDSKMQKLLTVQYYALKETLSVDVEVYGLNESGKVKYDPGNLSNVA